MILGGFIQVMEEMSEYLLNPCQLILEPEYIYMDAEKKNVRFCYLPGFHGEVQKQFQNLAEYFLPKLDHEDGKAVMLGYGVYRRALEDSFHLEHIKKELYKVREGKESDFMDYEKKTIKEPEKIEYIIANCAECEPYLTADYRRMLENPEELVAGMKIILQIFDKAKGVFGVENNKPDCIAKLQELTKDEPRMEVCPLQTKYPQGGERQLIYAVTGRAINSKMLPADAGCIVDNVETIIAIYNAVKLGKPVMNRVSTITGDAVANPGNFLYYIGTNYAELVEAAGGFKVQPEKIISGGPMMGFSMFSLDIPTTKTSSSLLCLAEDEVAKAEPSPCINCGRCVEACPEQLIPSRLAKMADHGVADEFEKWHGLECIECGSCSFACPAKRQLAQSIKTMKKQVLAAKRKK